MCTYDDVTSDAVLELERIDPHPIYFLTLCLDDDIKIESFEPLEEPTDEEQGAYILEFIVP